MLVNSIGSAAYYTGVLYRTSVLFFNEPPVFLQVAFLTFEFYKLALAIRSGFPKRYWQLLHQEALPDCQDRLFSFGLPLGILLSAGFISWNSQSVLLGSQPSLLTLSQNYLPVVFGVANFISTLMLSYGAFRLIDVYGIYKKIKNERLLSPRKKATSIRVSHQVIVTFLLVATFHVFKQKSWQNVVANSLLSALEVCLPLIVGITRLEKTEEFKSLYLLFRPRADSGVAKDSPECPVKINSGVFEAC